MIKNTGKGRLFGSADLKQKNKKQKQVKCHVFPPLTKRGDVKFHATDEGGR